MTGDFFTISELNKYIKDVINAGFPQPLWVCGEIQQFDRNRGKKHIFFELVEKDDRSKDINARIGLVLFAGAKPRIEAILKQSDNPFTLKDGIEVKFFCRVDFYAPHGAVRLIVEGIDPYYTLGKLAQEKQKLIKLLAEKGVLDKNKALELPLVPINVGLISSHDSAAYNDFLAEFSKSGYSFKVTFQNALMQGKEAERDIVKALDRFAQIKSLDCIVITRGGGSLSDLSCFDSQLIAEKIASLNLPVLSGIGHEINISITDLAAHTYAKTPTAIAQLIVERIRDYDAQLELKLSSVIDGANAFIERERNQLRENSHALHNVTMAYLRDHQEQLVRFKETIRTRPDMMLKAQSQILKEAQMRVMKAPFERINSSKEKLKSYDRIINAYHPQNTLKRGFSITKLKDGDVLKKISQINAGEKVLTEVFDGSFESVAGKINANKEK